MELLKEEEAERARIDSYRELMRAYDAAEEAPMDADDEDADEFFEACERNRIENERLEAEATEKATQEAAARVVTTEEAERAISDAVDNALKENEEAKLKAASSAEDITPAEEEKGNDEGDKPASPKAAAEEAKTEPTGGKKKNKKRNKKRR